MVVIKRNRDGKGNLNESGILTYIGLNIEEGRTGGHIEGWGKNLGGEEKKKKGMQ